MRNYEFLWPPCRGVQVVRLRKTWKKHENTWRKHENDKKCQNFYHPWIHHKHEKVHKKHKKAWEIMNCCDLPARVYLLGSWAKHEKNMKIHEKSMRMTNRIPIGFYAKSMQKAWFLKSSKMGLPIVLFTKNMQKARFLLIFRHNLILSLHEKHDFCNLAKWAYMLCSLRKTCKKHDFSA